MEIIEILYMSNASYLEKLKCVQLLN